MGEMTSNAPLLSQRLPIFRNNSINNNNSSKTINSTPRLRFLLHVQFRSHQWRTQSTTHSQNRWRAQTTIATSQQITPLTQAVLHKDRALQANPLPMIQATACAVHQPTLRTQVKPSTLVAILDGGQLCFASTGAKASARSVWARTVW